MLKRLVEKHKDSIRKIMHFIIIFIVVYFFVDMLVINDNCVLKQHSIKRELKRLNTEVSLLQKENEKLQVDNERLKDDPEEIEKKARTNYLFHYPDEKIYRFVND
ncbi:MAG: septum formation initiator family protein [Candidatus Cloacimonadales bacterium]|jgi:cell division protein FtsB|nr:septum formation initiator family protein [Candidatus Cloacimonadota bacterium]MDD3501349.1 septum formation initiator family protein [Candidatus Cloacimonadota bacterium]MDX9977567.1 septum formation initiator family protein [Candidatus Cloacimonadales bacterium]